MTTQMQTQEIGELLAALSKAQAIMSGAKEDSNNPFFKSKYADLTSVWAAARGPLTSNGLSVIQTLEYTGSNQALVTILGHSSGQWMRSVLVFPENQKNPQDIGKVLTYYRRYMLAAIVGICPYDDDAEESMQQFREKQEEAKVEYISKQEAQKIEDMIGDDIEYRKTLLKGLSQLPENKKNLVLDFTFLPKQHHERMMQAIQKRNENRLKSEMSNMLKETVNV